MKNQKPKLSVDEQIKHLQDKGIQFNEITIEEAKSYLTENKKLYVDFDYSKVKGLRKEAMQKLNLYKPMSVGQASRISGVSPADISVLIVYLEQHGSRQSE